ncbi:MAG: VanW family protein [Clostridiales bacterium]|nr:VanW family protein [Clostridiales bacterium]
MKKLGKSIYIIAISVCLFFAAGAAKVPDGKSENTESYPTLTVQCGKDAYVYTDKPVIPSDFTVIEQIEARRINAPLAQKIEYMDECIARGADYKTAVKQCFPVLVRQLDGIADGVFVAPVNAKTEYRNGVFTVLPEKAGRRLNEEKLYASIYCAFKFSGGGEVKAYTSDIQPIITADMLRAELLPRSTYTTDFSGSTEERAHNIKLALSKIDGIVIPAGETLSFNSIVGERTEANGYKKAKIIVDGKYTDGYGGGVCQASTAVYNAALTAGLNCIANAHSICPSYCPAGLDAMISSISDLLITNTTTHSVYISTCVAGRKGTVRIFGEKPEYTIEPESVVVNTEKYEEKEQVDYEYKYFDRGAASGSRLLVSQGKDGIISETYVNLYKDGKPIKRVKVRENAYKAVPQIIAVAP